MLSELIEELNTIKQERAKIAEESKKLSARDTEISNAILDEMENAGLTRAESNKCLVSSIKKTVAKIVDKEAYCNYVFNNKNTGLVNTRISSTAIAEMLEDGALADGVELVEINKLSFKKGL